MNAYDEALYKVLDLENGMLRHKLADKFRDRRCSNTSNHAGRPVTRDEDFHKGPDPMLSETSVRELAGNSDSSDCLPPYPRAHTYKSTTMKKSTDKDYETVRECHAENQLSAKRALKGFYLRCEPNISLSGAKTKEEGFKVLTQNSGKLMPKSEVFGKDIYEDKEEITHSALNNPFLIEPKMESSRQSNDDEVKEIQEG